MQSIRLALAIFLLFGLIAPAGAQDDPSTGTLTGRIRAAVKDANLGDRTDLVLHVRELRRGVTVTEIGPDEARKPASLMKLNTVAAALDVLGPTDTFTTRLYTEGVIENGILLGDIIIKGGGDPTPGPRFTSDRANVTGQMDAWVAALKAKGIRRINGNILGDGSRYSGDRISPYWDQRDLAEWYSAEVTALAYNDNVHDVLWNSGGKTGSRADFELIPPTKYFAFNSSVRVGPEGQIGSRARYFRFKETSEVRARGTLPPNSTKYDLVAMYDPAAWVAWIFMERLAARGIAVEGTAMNRASLAEYETDPTTDTLTLATQVSPSLSEMLPVVLGESQNLYAEMILRETALAMNEPPTFNGGSAAITRWLRDKRLHRTGFLATDGSGLGSLNRTTARQITDLLAYMNTTRQASLWRESLATPGTRSMKSRMTTPVFAGLRDRLQAKTGYVTGAHTLAGYIRSRTGKDYAFAIMLTDYDAQRSLDARDLVDRIVLLIDQSNDID